MVRHKKLTFFEPFLFYAKSRCEKNSRFLNHFDRFLARRLLSNEAFEKLVVFVTVQNLVARKTYVLGTIQLNHIIPLNVVARETDSIIPGYMNIMLKATSKTLSMLSV